MKIRKEDYREILDHFVKKRWQGEEYVAFPDGDYPLGKEELFMFHERYDAKEFCHEMATDVDRYDSLAIRSAYRPMVEAMNDSSLLKECNGIVDVALLVAMRHQRLETEQITNEQNPTIMNIKNFEYLRDQVKYTGFGEGLESSLKAAIEKGGPDFKLQHQTQYGNDRVTAELHFSQSKQSDMYFFNKYDVSMERGSRSENMEQTFYINKGNNITLKEAYNLMDGRSVNKDLTNKQGEVYNAWIQMDFKQSDDNGNFKLKHYHQNYGYNLEAALSKHPIKELGHEEYKGNLLDSLKKGNRQSATFQVDGTEQKHYIETNPQFKTINIYDNAMQRLDSRQSKKETQSQSEGQSAGQDNKQQRQATVEDDGPEILKTANKKRKRQSQSV